MHPKGQHRSRGPSGTFWIVCVCVCVCVVGTRADDVAQAEVHSLLHVDVPLFNESIAPVSRTGAATGGRRLYVLDGLQPNRRYSVRLSYLGSPSVAYDVTLRNVPRRMVVVETAAFDRRCADAPSTPDRGDAAGGVAVDEAACLGGYAKVCSPGLRESPLAAAVWSVVAAARDGLRRATTTTGPAPPSIVRSTLFSTQPVPRDTAGASPAPEPRTTQRTAMDTEIRVLRTSLDSPAIDPSMAAAPSTPAWGPRHGRCGVSDADDLLPVLEVRAHATGSAVRPELWPVYYYNVEVLHTVLHVIPEPVPGVIVALIVLCIAPTYAIAQYVQRHALGGDGPTPRIGSDAYIDAGVAFLPRPWLLRQWWRRIRHTAAVVDRKPGDSHRQRPRRRQRSP